MADRQLSETDLRGMLHEAQGYRADIEPGRWIIEARHEDVAWEVIVEPEEAPGLLVVVTAYPVE
jgi:hypothetical protein